MAKTRAQRSSGPKPPASATESSSVSALSLESFLVACQKSLARSVRSSQQAAQADNEFALGDRPQYAIDGIEFEVSAALGVNLTETHHDCEQVLLDLNAPAELRSRLRFRVQSRPVALLTGAKLELANLDPLGKSPGIGRLRAWLVDEAGRPIAGAEIRLHFARAGEAKAKAPIPARTDSAGRVDFIVQSETNKVKVVGDRKRKKVFLRGGGRGVNADEFFVWATAVRKKEWGVPALPSPPHPPTHVSIGEDGQATELVSQLHRLRIE